MICLNNLITYIKRTYYFIMIHTDITMLIITYIILLTYLGWILDTKTYIKAYIIVVLIYYIPLFYLFKKHKYEEYLMNQP